MRVDEVGCQPLAQKAVLAADQGLAAAGIDYQASLLATKLANVCLSHTECVLSLIHI